MNRTANQIHKKAIELGYEQCGIISIDATRDYSEKLTERLTKIGGNPDHFGHLYRYSSLEKQYPWAKSIVVCARNYGKYTIPEHLNGLIGKSFLFDSRADSASSDYQDSIKFEEYLHLCGFKTECDRNFGITALRWAARKAGLGIIRRNNFFYTDNGSWVHLEAWLLDAELELIHQSQCKPCPPDCKQCISSCPTKSLSEPFTMNPATCISFLTTWDNDMINCPHSSNIGTWIYGCDACQDACPMNKGKWNSTYEFPSLQQLSELIDISKIIQMDYDDLQSHFQNKFWYISSDRIWKWKVNALNAIRNSKDKTHNKLIELACSDKNETVRQTAAWVREISK